jgi:protein farnesyltransferase/geranylgeranyltransferase type-1 subunit alpha
MDEKSLYLISFEWKDVKLMDLFRAIINKKEYSKRALQLTYELIEINPASYTVWQYRRECLRALKANLYDELEFMDSFASDNPKNYQIWFHRRAVVDLLGDASQELAFTEEVFEGDAKNYHAWAHRQYIVKKYDLWSGELHFIDQMIEKDLRNNSAWNHVGLSHLFYLLSFLFPNLCTND